MGAKTKIEMPTLAAANLDFNNPMEQMMKSGQDAMAKQMESTMKTAGEHMEKAAGISKENMEALAQSSTIVAKGFEEMSKNMMEWMQSAMAQSMTASKQMLAVKTLRELVDLQTEFMRTWMDSSMAETTKISEISARVANQAMSPINQRVNDIVETMTHSKAA